MYLVTIPFKSILNVYVGKIWFILNILLERQYLFPYLSITAPPPPHICNISELLPKMATCNVEIVPETLDN